MSFFTSKPSGILRLFFDLPIYLYRLRLGWLLGRRFLLLTHRGRKTGRVRQTVLEVIRYDASTRESTVISGWGRGAEWYRNIEEAPALAIQTGCQRFDPVQRILSRDEASSLLDQWQKRHPIEALIFRKLFELPPNPTREALGEFAESRPLISFRPKPLPTRR